MKTSPAATLSLLLLGAACAPAHAGGPRVEQTRDLFGFTKIETSGAFDVRVTRGDTYRVLVVATAEDLGHVRTERSGDTLEIDGEGVRRFGGGKIQVHVTLPKLERIEASGATELRARNLAGTTLEVDASGASHLVLSGEVDNVSYTLSGATKLDALALRAKAVKIDASGATKAKVRATSALTAEASGASRIRYAGQPEQVTSDLSGAGSLERL